MKDALGNPLAGVDVYASDNNQIFSADGFSDQNGNYAIGVLGGLNNDPWQMDVNTGHTPGNYIYSQGTQAALSVGQAYHYNFTAVLAASQITGHVQQSNDSPIAGVQVYAYANINGQSYQTQADTDSNGNYSLNVANGNWSVGVSCQGGSDSLDGILGSGNYQCPNNQSATINNNNSTANFPVQPCNGVEITTTSPLPDGQVGSPYFVQFKASSCNGNFTWSVNGPQDVPPGLTLYSGGAFNGTPGASGTFNFSVHVSDSNGNSTNQNFSLTIAGSPLQVTTTFLPGGTNGEPYSRQLQASGGQTPYSWSARTVFRRPAAKPEPGNERRDFRCAGHERQFSLLRARDGQRNGHCGPILVIECRQFAPASNNLVLAEWHRWCRILLSTCGDRRTTAV